jgi:hypothetical protein
MAALSGVLTDYNAGSQIRTQSEAIGSVVEQQGIWAQAEAFQALVYSAMSLFGITAGQAVAASGTVTFSTSSTGTPPPATQNVSIPAGTIVQTTGGVQFQTTTAATLSSGLGSIDLPVSAVVAGSAGNVPAGAINTIISGLTYPLFVTNAAATANGADAQSAAQSLALFAAQVASIGLSSPVAIANAAMGVSYGAETVQFSTCFDKETEILTNCGWKNVKDIVMADDIATLNPATHILEFHKPLALQRKWFSGELIRMNNRFIDVAVTPDHNMYVRARGEQQWKFRKAKDVVKNNQFKRNAVWNGCEISEYVIGKHRISMDTWLEFLGYFISEGCAGIYSGTRPSKSVSTGKHKRQIRDVWKDTQYSIQISQTKGTNYDKIRQCMQNMPFTIHATERTLVIHNRALCHELLPLGKSFEKYIPRYVFDLSPRQMRILLDALWVGDGHVRFKNGKACEFVYSTSSKRLANDIQELAFKAGICASITVQDRRSRAVVIKGRGVTGYTKHLTYTVRLHTEHLITTLNHEPTRLPYEDNVYCLTVPNHIVYTRRKGKPCWVGQCYEPWVVAGSGAGSGVAGWDLYIDNGTGTASSGLISAVVSKITGGTVSGASNASGAIGYRDAGVPYNVYAVTPTQASVSVSATVVSGTGLVALVSGAIATAVSGYFTLPFGAPAEQSQISAAIANAVLGNISSLSVALTYTSGGGSVDSVTTSPSGRVILGALTQSLSQ